MNKIIIINGHQEYPCSNGELKKELPKRIGEQIHKHLKESFR